MYNYYIFPHIERPFKQTSCGTPYSYLCHDRYLECPTGQTVWLGKSIQYLAWKCKLVQKNYANHHLTNWVSLACQELGSEIRISNNRHGPKENCLLTPFLWKDILKRSWSTWVKCLGFLPNSLLRGVLRQCGDYTFKSGLSTCWRASLLSKYHPHLGSIASLITQGTCQNGGRPLDLRRKEARGTGSGERNDFKSINSRMKAGQLSGVEIITPLKNPSWLPLTTG